MLLKTGTSVLQSPCGSLEKFLLKKDIFGLSVCFHAHAHAHARVFMHMHMHAFSCAVSLLRLKCTHACWKAFLIANYDVILEEIGLEANVTALTIISMEWSQPRSEGKFNVAVELVRFFCTKHIYAHSKTAWGDQTWQFYFNIYIFCLHKTQNSVAQHKIWLLDTNCRASILVMWHKFGRTAQNSCFVLTALKRAKQRVSRLTL
jgi:hypothetical protein